MSVGEFVGANAPGVIGAAPGAAKTAVSSAGGAVAHAARAWVVGPDGHLLPVFDSAEAEAAAYAAMPDSPASKPRAMVIRAKLE